MDENHRSKTSEPTKGTQLTCRTLVGKYHHNMLPLGKAPRSILVFLPRTFTRPQRPHLRRLLQLVILGSSRPTGPTPEYVWHGASRLERVSIASSTASKPRTSDTNSGHRLRTFRTAGELVDPSSPGAHIESCCAGQLSGPENAASRSLGFTQDAIQVEG